MYGPEGVLGANPSPMMKLVSGMVPLSTATTEGFSVMLAGAAPSTATVSVSLTPTMIAAPCAMLA